MSQADRTVTVVRAVKTKTTPATRARASAETASATASATPETPTDHTATSNKRPTTVPIDLIFGFTLRSKSFPDASEDKRRKVNDILLLDLASPSLVEIQKHIAQRLEVHKNTLMRRERVGVLRKRGVAYHPTYFDEDPGVHVKAECKVQKMSVDGEDGSMVDLRSGWASVERRFSAMGLDRRDEAVQATIVVECSRA